MTRQYRISTSLSRPRISFQQPVKESVPLPVKVPEQSAPVFDESQWEKEEKVWCLRDGAFLQAFLLKFGECVLILVIGCYFVATPTSNSALHVKNLHTLTAHLIGCIYYRRSSTQICDSQELSAFNSRHELACLD